jgi:hypothetical protein
VAIFPAISRNLSEVLDRCGFFVQRHLATAYSITFWASVLLNHPFIPKTHPTTTHILTNRMARRRWEKRRSRPVSRVLYALRRDSHSSRPDVTVWLQQPTREQRGPRYRSPIRSCSGWGLPCHATLSPRAVRSYRTVSPLPVPDIPKKCPAIGGLLSVALAVSSRCPGVTWHPALWSPDFPRCAYARRDCPADSATHCNLSAIRQSWQKSGNRR